LLWFFNYLMTTMTFDFYSLITICTISVITKIVDTIKAITVRTSIQCSPKGKPLNVIMIDVISRVVLSVSNVPSVILIMTQSDHITRLLLFEVLVKTSRLVQMKTKYDWKCFNNVKGLFGLFGLDLALHVLTFMNEFKDE